MRGRRVFPVVTLSAALAVAPSCATLAPMETGVCGNGVVDPGEECDTHAVGGGAACRQPGAALACRFDCAEAATGVRPVCPAGWGCAVEGICRRASGRFLPPLAPVPSGAWRLLVGDFDHDGRADVVSRERQNADGASKLRVHYFGSGGALERTTVIPAPFGSPLVADLSGDGRDDLAFTYAGVGVLLGQADRSFLPVAYSTLSIPVADARLFALRGFPSEPTFAVLATTPEAGTALVRVDSSGSAGGIIAIEQGPGALAGDAIIADVLDDPTTSPCDDLVLAYVGESVVHAVSTCKPPANGGVEWNEGGAEIRVALPGGATVDRGVTVADADGDGHLDLLIGASARAYVAYGTGRGFASAPRAIPEAVPNVASLFTLPLRGDDGVVHDAEAPFPYAAGDLNGDTRPDFVFATAILASTRRTDGALAYAYAHKKLRGEWTTARMADLNANGKLDVIAASSDNLDLDFFNGTGTGALTPSSIPTSGPISHITLGDFDGDLIEDVCFAERRGFGPKMDEVSIAWGSPSGAPSTVVSVGRFDEVAQLFPYSSTAGGVRSGAQNLLIVSAARTPEGTSFPQVAFLGGSSNRQPLATFGLRQVSGPSPLNGEPLALAAGPVVDKTSADLVAIGFDLNQPASSPAAFRLWLLAARGGGEFDLPAPGPQLPTDASILSDVGPSVRGTLLFALGDMDGDGLAEAVGLTPSRDLRGGLLLVGHASGVAGGSFSYAVPEPTPIDTFVSASGQLELADVDGDGARDIVLLTADDAATERDVRIFWNDGRGGFSGTDALSVARARGDAAPHGFAVLPTAPGTPSAIAYVTRRSVVVAHLDGRAVKGTDRVGRAVYATAVARADIDGDGVADLVVADGGTLVVFRGEAALR